MPRLPIGRAALLAVLLAGCLLASSGCGGRGTGSSADGAVVARVGDAVLTEADLAADASVHLPGLDSTAARQRAVEAWVMRELLVAEARRTGLDRDPAVERRLAESARAVLTAAARDRLLDAEAAVSEADVAAAYQARREALALREPYVRLRHLRVPTAQAAEAEVALAEAARAADPDAAFAAVARRFARASDGGAEAAVAFARSYVSVSRLAAHDPALAARVAALTPGPTVATVPDGPLVHVVQLVERVAAGTVPPLAVVAAELAEQLRMERETDAEARLLERLRAEAVARGDLEVRTAPR